MPDTPNTPRARRKAAPSRDILASQVRAEELPDIARPLGPAAQASDVADATDAPDATDVTEVTVVRDDVGEASLVDALTGALVELGRAPFALTDAMLEDQAKLLDDWVGEGRVPALWVPGARLLKVELRLMRRMIGPLTGRAADPVAPPSGTAETAGEASSSSS
jgi:hypothetical protein